MAILGNATPYPVITEPKPLGPRNRVLVLAPLLPDPSRTGHAARLYYTLKVLASRFDVALALTRNVTASPDRLAGLETLANPIAVPKRSDRSLGPIGTAMSALWVGHGNLTNTISKWHTIQPFDAILSSGPKAIPIAQRILAQSNRPCHVIDLVETEHDWASNPSQIGRSLRRFKIRELEPFDALTVPSQIEASWLNKHLRPTDLRRVHIVRHALPVRQISPLPDADTRNIVFLGAFDRRENVAGITWFVRRVMPILAKGLDGTHLWISGAQPTWPVQILGDFPGVDVVEDIGSDRTCLHRATAVIGPSQTAMGVQTMVLEAMASARAVVCSKNIADGIAAVNGKHLLIADQVEDWADQLLRLLTNTELRRRLAGAARQQVEQVYDWEQALAPLASLLAGDPAPSLAAFTHIQAA